MMGKFIFMLLGTLFAISSHASGWTDLEKCKENIKGELELIMLEQSPLIESFAFFFAESAQVSGLKTSVVQVSAIARLPKSSTLQNSYNIYFNRDNCRIVEAELLRTNFR